MKRIYLSGNMTPDPSYYQTWTAELRRKLSAYSDQYVTSASVVDEEVSNQSIVNHDLARLKMSDLVVVNTSVAQFDHHLTGVVVEIYEAFKQNKVVYTFGDNQRVLSEQIDSPWIEQFVTRHFYNMSDLIQFLLVDNL